MGVPRNVDRHFATGHWRPVVDTRCQAFYAEHDADKDDGTIAAIAKDYINMPDELDKSLRSKYNAGIAAKPDKWTFEETHINALEDPTLQGKFVQLRLKHRGANPRIYQFEKLELSAFVAGACRRKKTSLVVSFSFRQL